MATEDLVFDEQDESERDGPVSEQRDEIGHDGGEVLAAGNSDDSDDKGVEEGPDETRDGVEVVAEEL